jgi:RNA polymerase sigma factor (sigma-70 family)
MIDFEDAFDELYRMAYRVAFRVVGDRGDAEDVAQEAIVRAALHWRRVSGYETAWVSRVSGNLAIDRLRSRQRRVRREARVVAATVGGGADEPQIADSRVQAALMTLPRRQREVVVLRYAADQSEDVVAQMLGCSVGTVKTHASRGLSALRTAMEDER